MGSAHMMWVHGNFVLASVILSTVWYGVVSLHSINLVEDSPHHPEGTTQRIIDDFPPDNYITQDVFKSYPCLPKHIHIAQANDVDESGQVSFTVSLSLTYGLCDSGRPVIFYGQGMQEIGRIRGTKPVYFNYTSNLSEGLFHSDWIYHMQLPNLKAGMHRYWYRIAVEQEDRSSHATTAAQRTLRGSHGYYLGETQTIPLYTPPLPHSPTALALVGDLGQTPNSMRTLRGIYESTLLGGGKITKDHSRTPVTQLLIAGDMSYADTDPWRWLSWMTLVEPLVRSTPLHVAAGNHEIECDTNTHDIFVPYEHYFRNPNRIGPSETKPVSDAYRKTLWNGSCGAPSPFQGVYNFGNSFYSYRHGLAHIIVLNSYTNTSEDSVQYQWFVEELETRVDRAHTPWLVVAFHAPFYTTFMGHIDEIEATVMRDTMEPLFVQYGVNLVVSGAFWFHFYVLCTMCSYAPSRRTRPCIYEDASNAARE